MTEEIHPRFPPVTDDRMEADALLKESSVDLAKLSPAEAMVVALLARGLSNDEIARTQGKSLGTVKNQLSSAYRKLGVSSRTRLMAALK